MTATDTIREAMRELGRRKKTMSPAALAQRAAAGKASVAKRKAKASFERNERNAV